MPMLLSQCCRNFLQLRSTRCGYTYFQCDLCEIECEVLLSSPACDTIKKNTLSRTESVPKFSQDSFSKLSTCHHDLQVLFFEVIKTFDCIILEGYRNQEDQERAFELGTSKLHFPHGKHNKQPSMAVDATPYPVKFNDSKLLYWFGGLVQGVAQRLKEEGKMELSIRWGGSWNGLGDLNGAGELNDLVHFELI